MVKSNPALITQHLACPLAGLVVFDTFPSRGIRLSKCKLVTSPSRACTDPVLQSLWSTEKAHLRQLPPCLRFLFKDTQRTMTKSIEIFSVGDKCQCRATGERQEETAKNRQI